MKKSSLKQFLKTLLISICGLSLSFSALATNEEMTYPDLTGQKLVVYITFHETEGLALLNAFKKHTGVDFVYSRAPAGETTARVMAEKEHPRADIMIGGGAENYVALKSMGLLESYKSQLDEKIDPVYKDADHQWYAFYRGPIAIGINKTRWDKEFAGKVELPKSYEDLLNPIFKNEIVFSDPARSGTGYTFLSSLVQYMGEENAFKLLTGLKNQAEQLPASGFKPTQLVGQGEYLICINFIFDQLLVKSQGMPVESIVPEGAGWEMGGVAVIKNSPNPVAAKVFLDFMLSKEAGEIHTGITYRLSVRDDVSAPSGLDNMDALPINKKFDIVEAGKERTRLIARWNELK